MWKLPQRFSWQFWLLVAIALAVILRIVNLGTREFWYDEVLSLLLSTGQKSLYSHPPNSPINLAQYVQVFRIPVEENFNDLLTTLEKLLKGLVGEPHPPLFYLGQHLWLRLGGNSESALRSLNVIYSIGAIVCAYGLGRRLLGHRGGLILAALLGTNDYYLFHSLNLRMYAPLVFWVILSSWAMLELIYLQQSTNPSRRKSQLLVTVVLIGSVTGGIMTFYLFAYHLLALAALVLLLARRKWWQYGLYLATGVAIATPWLWWGTRQQLRNADFGRFSAKTNFWQTSWQHLQDVLNTLGIHLVLGDWISSLPPWSDTLAGVVAVIVLAFCSITLWQQQQQRLLFIALLLGIFPLLLALAADFLSGKFTLGFGWGRSMITILPGCLLLLAIWLEKAAGRWQATAALCLLLFYLSVSIGDYSLRSRRIFHHLTAILEEQPTTPTLIAMNSKAWGHVLRLAYYLPPDLPVELLASSPASLAPNLQKTLNNPQFKYSRVIWLDSARPVWSMPKTEAEARKLRQEVKNTLEASYQFVKTEPLSGTMHLDRFTTHIYQVSND